MAQLKSLMPRQQQVSTLDIYSTSYCYPFIVERSIFDIAFNIRVMEGDQIEWSVYQSPTEQGGNSELILRTFESSFNNRQQILVRTFDRWRNGEPTSNLIYLCASQVLLKSSLEIAPFARETLFNRFVLLEDQLSTFVLDSRDFV